MLKETYGYIVAVFMVSTLYNLPKAHSRVCTSETRRRGPHPQGICGDRISEILGLYCGPFGYNSRVKRDMAKEKERKQLDDVTVSRETANAYLVQKKMRWHNVGIVCECCYHSCTGTEILTYCLAPFTSFRKRDDQILKQNQEQKLLEEPKQQQLKQQQHLQQQQQHQKQNLQQKEQQQQHQKQNLQQKQQQQQHLHLQQQHLQQHLHQQIEQQHLKQQQQQQK